MASVFDLFDEIRRRPGLYLGWDESQRRKQLDGLEMLLCGYWLALRQYGIQEPIMDFWKELTEYTRETRGWETSCGPVAVIRDSVKTEEEIWDRFWELVEEFRTAVNARSK